MDFEDFHRRVVPDLLAGDRGRAAGRAVGAGGRLGLRLAESGATFTYGVGPDGLEVVAGDNADVLVELDAAAFEDLLSEAWSVYGLLYADRVAMVRGSFGDFAAWETPLQALWFDRPIYGAEVTTSLVDAAGRPLDLQRSFTLDDDDDAIGWFLSVTGFVVVRGVFSSAEIAGLRSVVGEERAKVRPGDGRSWWASTADGGEVCCRLTYMADRSPVVADLGRDPRLNRLARLADPELRPCLDRMEGVSVVIKHPQVTSGLSDLPWHRDCGIGGHRVLCPGLNVGIQLDRADAGNGQLRFLAGSHHHASQLDLPEAGGLPVVAVEADPGDVTVHFGHTLHLAPPPLAADAGRQAMYVGYHLPAAFDLIGPGQSYNDVLVKRDAGRVRSVDEVATA